MILFGVAAPLVLRALAPSLTNSQLEAPVMKPVSPAYPSPIMALAVPASIALAMPQTVCIWYLDSAQQGTL